MSLHCETLQNAFDVHRIISDSHKIPFSCATGSLSPFPKRNVSSLPHLVLATPPLIISFFFWEIKRMCCPSHERRVFSFFLGFSFSDSRTLLRLPKAGILALHSQLIIALTTLNNEMKLSHVSTCDRVRYKYALIG